MPDVVLRRAESRDRDDVRRWRNDTAARAASLSSKVIEPGEHARWFAAAIADPERFFLIAEDGPLKVGSIRFDRIDDDAWRVNIFLNPQCFHQGYGSAILSAGSAKLFDETAAKRIAAEVKTENVASITIFERCGYERVAESYGVARFVKRRPAPQG